MLFEWIDPVWVGWTGPVVLVTLVPFISLPLNLVVLRALALCFEVLLPLLLGRSRESLIDVGQPYFLLLQLVLFNVATASLLRNPWK